MIDFLGSMLTLIPVAKQEYKFCYVAKKRQKNIYSDLDSRLHALDEMHELDIKGHKQHQSNPTPVIKKPIVNAQTDKPAINEPLKPAVDIEKVTYQTAYNRLKNGHTARAISAFNDFLKKYPDSDYADNSQYWLGEAYKVNQDLNASKTAFKKVITHYQGSPKVADALLKLGYIALEQKQRTLAIDYLKQVKVSHPKTTAAHLATKKLIQIGAIQP